MPTFRQHPVGILLRVLAVPRAWRSSDCFDCCGGCEALHQRGIQIEGSIVMMFKTLDVAIGISFLYLLTTLAASAIVEFISNWQNWRGQMLYAGIGNMLSNST